MIKKIRALIAEQARFDPAMKKISEDYGIPIRWLHFDSLRSRFLHGFDTSEYLAFDVFNLNHRARKRFLSSRRAPDFARAVNGEAKSEIEIMNNKAEFNRLFSAYVKRAWVYAPEGSKEEIRALLEQNEYVIAKPLDKMRGEGVTRLKCSELLADFDAFCEKAVGTHLLLEEVIKQHPALAAVNPTSVNTIRASTLRDRSGKVHFFAASLRGGAAGSVIDNLHIGGAQYPIDLETGVIMRGGVTAAGQRNIWFHPSTNTKMIGMQIPNWDAVVKTVTEAAAVPEKLRYIGWDVAVTEDGCELIEGNFLQGCNGMQLDGVGKFSYVKRYK